MSAIAHYIEAAGIPTAGISLVRENTERSRPPRALWVPFDLGRPFGVPDNPAFQTEVLRAVLGLLERTDGPVILDDFPKDAAGQNATDNADGMVCPVRFKALPPEHESDLLARIHGEMTQLAPWYELFVGSRRSSTVGVSQLAVRDAVVVLHSVLQSGGVDSVSDDGLGRFVRYACEDMRNWHLEAAQARPGGPASATALANWFWGETGAGQLILDLHPVCAASQSASLRQVGAWSLVPRAQMHRLSRRQAGASSA